MFRFALMCVKSFLLSMLLLLSCTPCTVGCNPADTGTDGVQDKVPGWMELPELQDNLTFVTHPMTVDGRTTRNYSYAWDSKALVARWVAYPLNSRLRSGDAGRSDAWGLDPALPEDLQPVLYKGYGSKSWSRGHQIPSADRKIYKYNVQTFYGVNMTPQDADLNGGIWAKLEDYVRDRSNSFDTLYVVSGCVLEGSPGTVRDNVGKRVTIPSGYFKALLGYSRSGSVGNSYRQGGYTAIAFYMPNKAIAGKDYMSWSMTVSELEDKVGVNFFVNLPEAIPGLGTVVEGSRDEWWYR